MRLLQLQYFLDIGETLNITKSAQRMFVSQPAVSKQIAQLEKELGTKLIERTPKGLTLTTDGQSLLECLKRCHDDFVSVCSRFERAENKLTLAYTASINIGSVLLEAVNVLSGDGIQVAVEALNPNSKNTGNYDILISYESALPKDKTHTSLLYRATKFFAFSSNDPLSVKTPLTYQDFNQKKLFIGSYPEAHIALCGRLGVHPQVSIKSNVTSIILSVISQNGFCIIDELCKEMSFPNLSFFPTPDHENIVLAIHEHADDKIKSTAKKLTTILQALISDRLSG